MEYVCLGSSGLKISRIALGCWSFGNKDSWMIEIDKARPIIEKAIDLGVNYFDTSCNYSLGRSEEILGEAVKGRRNDVILATKVYGAMSERPNDRGLSRRHIMNQIERSLQRLGTDYVDLYAIHRWDYDTPIEETLRALDDLIHAGKIRYIGASSMFAFQFSKALWTSDRLGLSRFISMENLYNLCYREEEWEMIPLCRDQGVGLIPWSPLAKGFLTGKYVRAKTPDSVRYRSDYFLTNQFMRPEFLENNFDILDEVVRVAKEKGLTPAQVALAWLLHKGVVAPIVGATTVQQIEEDIEAVNVHLTQDEIGRLEAPYKPHPILPDTMFLEKRKKEEQERRAFELKQVNMAR